MKLFLGAILIWLTIAAVAVLWIARATIIHHTGADLFPMLKK